MNQLTGDEFVRHWLCPRCGTVRVDAGLSSGPVDIVPKLVERCREFIAFMQASLDDLERDHVNDFWGKFGIPESIHPTGDRK
jgi:hypothetical protein